MQDETHSLKSRRFNLTHENPNWINEGLFGEDFAVWMRGKLAERGLDVDDTPIGEDWGWTIDARLEGRTYSIGFQTPEPVRDENPEDPDFGEWWVRVIRRRSFLEWITGRGRLAEDDPMDALVTEILQDEELALSLEDWTPREVPRWLDALGEPEDDEELSE